MNNLRTTLENNLIGQPQFLPPVLAAITRYEAGLHFANRPAGSFMLLGPTGVGKTEAVELVAQAINGSKGKLITIHCAEFQHGHEVAKLIGAPPGYLGHRESPARLSPNALADAREHKDNLAVILFDEIEKAHEDVYRLCLGILEKGVLRGGDNKEVNFVQTLIFFTSNLGVSDKRRGKISFEQGVPLSRDMEIHSSVKRYFSPEFINRIDKFIVFNDLERADLGRIIEIYAKEANTQFSTRVQGSAMLRLVVSPGAVDRLIELGYSKEFGARQLRRVWERNVITPLAVYVQACGGSTKEWPCLRLDSAGGEFEFTPMSMSEVLAASLPAPPDPPIIDIFGAFSQGRKKMGRSGK